MTDTPLVSIVIQTFNRRDMLECALESARNQTYENLEILIGDNCSQDATEEYCIQQAAIDKRIRYFRHAENIGMVGNANFLLNKVTGKYFAFLNDDDWFDLDYVEKSLAIMEKDSKIAIAVPETLLYTPKGEFFGDSQVIKLSSPFRARRIRNYLKTMWRCNIATGLISSKVLERIKDKNDIPLRYRYAEDVTFIIKCLALGKGCHIVSTHLNKRDSGTTRDLQNTPEHVFPTDGLNNDNLLDRTCEIVLTALKTDPYFEGMFSDTDLKFIFRKLSLKMEKETYKFDKKAYQTEMQFIRIIKMIYAVLRTCVR